MEGDAFEAAMRAAMEELEGIQAAIDDLGRRRDALAAYVAAAREVLGQAPERKASLAAGAASPPGEREGGPGSPGAGAPVAVKRHVADALPPVEVSRLRSDRRRFLGGVVETVLGILRDRGAPMTAGELLDVHPDKDHIDEDLLYKTLHKRIERGKKFQFDRGYFWFLDVAYPPGWKHPRDR